MRTKQFSKWFKKLSKMQIFPKSIVVKTLIAGFLIFLGMFFYRTGLLFFPDSEGYINMDIYRSLGYPMFLQIHRYVFGSNYLQAAIITQFLLVLYSFFYFVQALKKTFLQNDYFLLIIFFLLCIPLFYEFKVANIILSEAVAYPLYLLSISQLFLGVFHKKVKHFYFGLLFTLLAVLVRGQFLFLIPVFIASILIAFRTNLLKKNIILLLASTVLLPFAAVATDISYHYIKHDIAATTPWTGIQIASLPFFVSDATDHKIFKNSKEQKYFTYIHTKLSDKNLLYSQIPNDKGTMIFYIEKYTAICNGTINSDGEMLFNNLKSDNEKVVANDIMSTKMAVPLIINNYEKYIKMYLQNIGFGFGTNKYFLLYLLLLGFSFFQIIKNQKSFFWIIFICCLCAIANILLVSLAEPSQSRYVFYNNWVLITIFLILFENLKSEKAYGH